MYNYKKQGTITAMQDLNWKLQNHFWVGSTLEI